VGHSKVAALRGSVSERVASNVVRTYDEDPAHADFVTTGSGDEDYKNVRDWLVQRLSYCAPVNVAEMVVANRPAEIAAAGIVANGKLQAGGEREQGPRSD